MTVFFLFVNPNEPVNSLNFEIVALYIFAHLLKCPSKHLFRTSDIATKISSQNHDVLLVKCCFITKALNIKTKEI